MVTLNKPKHSVLVVDDTNLSIMVLTHVLSPDYIVYAARTGKDAIQIAQEKRPDVILLDVVMPDIDGYAVIDALKQSDRTKSIPIIFITGMNKPGDEERGLTAGAADYILKPYSPATIRLRVRNQIEMIRITRLGEYNMMKYRLACDAMNVALWDMDIVDSDPVNQKNKFTWSDEFRRMLGFTDEKDFPNVLESWSNLLHPEDKRGTLAAFSAHINDRTGRTPYDVEYRLKLKNGVYRDFHALGATLRDSIGTPLRVAGAVNDITEKKAMSELLKYRDRMQTALNKMAVTLLSQTTETFDQNMSVAVRPIADAVGLNRVDIYRARDEGPENYFEQVYRWTYGSVGSAPLVDKLRAMPYSEPTVSIWLQTLQADGVINIHSGTMSEGEAGFLREFQVKSLLLIPVFRNEKLWGLVAFQDTVTDRLFDEDSIEILRSAAFLWAAARMNYQLALGVQESQIKLENLAYAANLNQTLSGITKSPTVSAGYLQEAAHLIAKRGCEALNASCLGIWLLSDDKTYLKNVSFFRRDSGEYTLQDDFDLIGRISYFDLLKSERLIVGTDPQSVTELFDTSGVYCNELCAILDAPIRLDGNLEGVVCIEQYRCDEYSDKREWTMNEKHFAASLADLMAVAISGEQRRLARESAEAASKAKSAFLAMMSHEIRTPMNAIWGITEILMQSGTLPGETTEGLNRIHNSCAQLLGIINDILDFSKIEAGKLDVTPEVYHTASMLTDSARMNMMRIGDKSIEFNLHVDENVPTKLVGDELRIKQILSNILSNAFKYTDAGTVELSVSIEQPDNAEAGGGQNGNGIILVFAVKDTGCGMSNEQIEHLFEEYSRFNKEHDGTIEGTGLGLSIVYRLINLMNGSIHVESKRGEGTLVRIRLPQERVDDAVFGKDLADNLRQLRVDAANQKRSAVVREKMPYGKVLIVDDMETNIYVAVRLMKPYGLQIDTVMSGREAIEKIEEGNVYHVIFMDHMMPEIDGIETTKRIRSLGYTPPVIALTANAVVGQSDMFLSNGFDAFVSKPIDIRQLDSVLNKFIRDRQSPEILAGTRQAAAEVDEYANKSNVSDGIGIHGDDMLLQSVIKDVKKAVVLLDDIVQNNTITTEAGLKSYTISVHGIKSSLANIGESALSAKASRLEQASRESAFEEINDQTPEFIRELRSLLEKWDAELSQHEQDGEDDIEQLQKKLQEVQSACEDYDRKGVLAVLETITQSSKTTRKVLETIKEHVIHSEFDEAGSLAASFIERNLK